MLPHQILFDEKTIRVRVDEMAESIASDLEGKQVILLGLLTGSFVFMADLARALFRFDIEPKVDFLAVSHYGQTKDPTRPVRIDKDTSMKVCEQAVLVVDDIVDSGRSLAKVMEHLRLQQPAWLRSCVFLDKPSLRLVPLKADYVGFEVEDVWLIGYGMDLAGEGRGLPYIGKVEQ
ncbi:MAG: hypoxanthine phosphoribosyltransferase [Nitrospirota bacterium]|nr:MAG: hypoxanthine phosphoribosyltransferase [Nitrospirota bacterium]